LKSAEPIYTNQDVLIAKMSIKMTTIIRENDFGYGGKYIENLPKGNEIYEIKPIKKKDFILICKEIGVLHKIEKLHYED
jgi:hypothetical protein